MKYIECPNSYEGNKRSLFLAGGITNCPRWQDDFVLLLEDTNLALFNPRRKEFNIKRIRPFDQIKWEFDYLEKATAISFWFPPDTLCPSTLYELGKASTGKKKLFIGVHPEYKRKIDVDVQTNLIRPEIEVVYSLENLSQQIKNWIKD